MIRSVRALLAIVGAALVAAFALAAPASAAPAARGAAGSAAPIAVLRAPMTLVCTAGTASRGGCASDGAAPDNRVSGDCGSSYIYLYDDGGGVARFEYGFASSLGFVVYRDLEVDWLNNDTGDSDTFYDSAGMNGPAYGNTAYQGTGTGNVYTVLSGSVVLASGDTCTLLNPWSTANIT